ncbi:MAG: hypothetical protein HY376_02785 [Candidatus Blackburnbacteria bacterium]|nr:hypothetical protein [Candidatus Blackburnbacteria bacterium]
MRSWIVRSTVAVLYLALVLIGHHADDAEAAEKCSDEQGRLVFVQPYGRTIKLTIGRFLDPYTVIGLN